MPPRPLALVTLLFASSLLAGCAAKDAAPSAVVDASPSPAVASLNGVANATGGDVRLLGVGGVAVREDAENATLALGLDGVVETNGVFHACDGACREFSTPRGMIIADGDLVALGNATVNALGPDGDSAVYFFDEGSQIGRFLQWSDRLARFRMNAALETGGAIRAGGGIGTTQGIVVGDAGGILVHTAAAQGFEDLVLLRGDGRLTNGTATIALPELFAAIVDSGTLTVQLTLTAPSDALYVSEKRGDAFVVSTVTGAASDATFDWFAQARRANTGDRVVAEPYTG